MPGPLIRLPLGGWVRVTVHNRLADTLRVVGLKNPRTSDTLVVPPGDSGRARFRTDRPGLYGYVGGTRRGTDFKSRGLGEQLVGTLAVDSANAPRDRIFAITAWTGFKPSVDVDTSFIIAVNGKIWPNTERLRVTVGDTVHWRLINLSGSTHPMHLHGTYFSIDARGTLSADTAFAPAARELAVTETLRMRETRTISWSPGRPGRWLFHCHDAFHVDGIQQTDLPTAARIWAASLKGPVETPATRPPAKPMGEHDQHGMAGLVLGIEAVGTEPSGPGQNPRRIDLLVQQRAKVYGDTVGIGFVAAAPGSVPADSIAIPGPPLVLTRGEPVAITVHNRLAIPTSVHWHGMELESYFDGVGGWSGTAGHIAPSIAPGDSFVARFTPPRAGTFIYHSHFGEVRQLSLGLYGALVVVDSGRRWDPERDRVVLFAVAGNDDSAAVVAHQDATALRRGVPTRIRFINITAADDVEIEAIQDGQAITWRRLAKDGAALSAPATQPGRLLFGPGETTDVEVTPRGAGPIILRVTSFNNFEVALPVR